VSPDLHKQLEALHGELARTQAIDGESRELLVRLLNDISRLLDSQPVAVEDAPLTERLDEMAVRFEAEHPSLGNAIRRVLDTLAKAGI
jgi:Domain of unknown function (DUF4404)